MTNSNTGLPENLLHSDVPLQAPETQASRLYPDKVVPGIEIRIPLVDGPGVGRDVGPGVCPDPLPVEHWHLRAATAVPVLIEDAQDFRRVVTFVGFGTAARVDVSHRQDFGRRTVIGAGVLPLDVPVAAGRQLWLRQTTGIDQDCDGYTEPRGPGR